MRGVNWMRRIALRQVLLYISNKSAGPAHGRALGACAEGWRLREKVPYVGPVHLW